MTAPPAASHGDERDEALALLATRLAERETEGWTFHTQDCGSLGYAAHAAYYKRRNGMGILDQHSVSIHGWGPTPLAAARALIAACDAAFPAYQESADDERLRNRMADLLTRTANALKGDPEPLHLHDWADLPEFAGLTVANEARLIAALAAAQAECARLAPYAEFGGLAFEEFWHDGEPGDVDAGTAQEWAVRVGLLRRRTEADAGATCGAADGCGWKPGDPISECECLFPTRPPFALSSQPSVDALRSALERMADTVRSRYVKRDTDSAHGRGIEAAWREDRRILVARELKEAE